MKVISDSGDNDVSHNYDEKDDLLYLFDYNVQNFELIFRQKSMLRVIHEV